MMAGTPKKEKKVKRRTNTIRQPRETRFWKDEKQPVTAAVEKLAKSSKDALENLELDRRLRPDGPDGSNTRVVR